MANERRIEMSLIIDCPNHDVWQALTQAEELVRWFPLQAEVEPGVGGHLTLGWGEALSNHCPIQQWQPGQHLRLQWSEGTQQPPLVVDFFLQSQGDGTHLRLVHSGFGSDASWDQEYDGIKRGWQLELRCLKHYLENHHGHERAIVVHRLPLAHTDLALWSRVIGRSGVFQLDDDLPEPGQHFQLGLPDGNATGATLLAYNSGQDFAAVTDSLAGGYLRLSVDHCSGALELWLWLASWQQDATRIAASADHYRQCLTHTLETNLA